VALRKYRVRRPAHGDNDEHSELLHRCYVVETSDAVLVEVGDRIVHRFPTMDAFLAAFGVERRDLREVGSPPGA
jgi:hypothetical protein